MRCSWVSGFVVILLVAYMWSNVSTAPSEETLCHYFKQQLLNQNDLAIISPTVDKTVYKKTVLESIISYCRNSGTVVRNGKLPDMLKWIPVVRTYIYCKLSNIILKLFLLIEYYSLGLFKTNNNVDNRSLKELDEVNWKSWETLISPELKEWEPLLKLMLLILRDFDENLPWTEELFAIAPNYDSKNVAYLMEAFKTYYLFLYDNKDGLLHSMSFKEIPEDKRINRVRLIHFYVWDLTEKYSKEQCNLNFTWKLSFLERFKIGKKDQLNKLNDMMITHRKESSVLLNTWSHNHSLDSSHNYFDTLVAIQRPNKSNPTWVQSLDVRAEWKDGKKDIMQAYKDAYIEFRPVNRVQFNSLSTEMVLSVFFYELYEYIQIYVTSVMAVSEKNIYFGKSGQTDPHLLQPVRVFITEMNNILKQKSWNSPSKNTIALIHKTITDEYSQDTIDMMTTVDESKNNNNLPVVTTLNVVDLLLTIEVLITNYRSMGIVSPKQKIKVYPNSFQADRYLKDYSQNKIQLYIDNIKKYIG